MPGTSTRADFFREDLDIVTIRRPGSQMPAVNRVTKASPKRTPARMNSWDLAACFARIPTYKAAVTNAATPTTDAVTGAAFVPVPIGGGSVFVFGYDSGGNIKVAQGSIVTLDATGAFNILPQFPIVPDTVCPFGYQLIQAAPATATTPAVATWTFGTNNNSSVTGVTYTMVDVMTLPDRPQAS